MKKLVVRIKNATDLPLPTYQTEGSAGFDFMAAVESPVTIEPGSYAVIPTGVSVAVPAGYELQVRGRSGLAAKHGVGLTNGVGTIDSDYRGEIKVILSNHGKEPFVIQRGERIAQGVIAPYVQAQWSKSDELDATSRADGGFGSTGK